MELAARTQPRAPLTEDIDERQAARVVCSVERDDTPVVVLERKETCGLPVRVTACDQAQTREQGGKVRLTGGVHLVVAVERKAPAATARPGDGMKMILGVGVAE